MAFCRTCGKQVADNAEICMGCGVRPLNGDKHCHGCGVETRPNQELCIKCGVRLNVGASTPSSSKAVITDFSALSPYYQEEFKRIFQSNETYKGKWNWAAFFFGAIWALTKGCWLSVIIAVIASIFTGGLAAVVYWFVWGARGNFMYYNAYAKKRQQWI